jgi:tRNA pseudouridine38-40 synthase
MSRSRRALTPDRLREGLNALVRPAPGLGPFRPRARTTGTPDSPASAGATCTGSSTGGRRRRSTMAGSGISAPLDADAMAQGAAHLVGRHDFTTFRSAHCQSDSPVKTLDRLDVSREGEEIRIEAAARSFLHHQVRSMVGCLALVGRGQWAPDISARPRSTPATARRSASTRLRTACISSKRNTPKRTRNTAKLNQMVTPCGQSLLP